MLSSGWAVTPGAAEGHIFRVVGGTLAAKGTFAVAAAFQRHLTFMGKSPVEFDFFADRRFIFANRMCNSGFCGTVGDSGKDDPSFFKSQMGKSICIVHMLPAFPAAVRQIKCKTKCSI